MSGPDIRIGITLGDPAGIGPEIISKTLLNEDPGQTIPIVIGSARVMKRYYPDALNALNVIQSASDIKDTPFHGKERGYFFDTPSTHPLPTPGNGTVFTGAESRSYIDAAIELWKRGCIDALVTGPVSKSFIEKSGHPFTGHTEYIAEAIGETDPFMMMFSRDYRVILATTHLPLSLVEHSINIERLLKTIETGHRAITAIDSREAKMAITGLDPHCGDDGAIGDFDERVTREAVFKARERGIDIEGPFAADTLFLPGRWKNYSLVVAQYHDQGLIPFKMLAFESGVNVTLGISMVRTSVDHGTAYDIAGKGTAGHSSFVEAYRLASRLALEKKVRRSA